MKIKYKKIFLMLIMVFVLPILVAFKTETSEVENLNDYYSMPLPKVSSINFSKMKPNSHKSVVFEERYAEEYGYSTVVDFPWQLKLPEGITIESIVKEGLVVVKKDNEIGYMNMEGKMVIPFISKIDYAYNFSEGIAIIAPSINSGENNKTKEIYAINKKGEEIFKLDYYKYDIDLYAFGSIFDYSDLSLEFKDGLLLFKPEDENYLYINKKGKEVLSLDYDKCYPFYEGMAVVYKEGKGYGFINKKGEEVIPCQYTQAQRFGEGIAVVSNDNMKSCFGIDKNGKIAVPPIKDKDGEEILSFNYYNDGLIFIDYGPFGYIGRYYDKKGVLKIEDKDKGVWHTWNERSDPKKILSVEYRHLQNIYGPLIENTTFYYSYFDTEGKRILPLQEYCEAFSEGYSSYNDSFDGNDNDSLLGQKGNSLII